MTRGPLSDTTVVEFAGIGPAPFACSLLADLGATVIRIERPGASDIALPGAERLGVEGRSIVELDLKDTHDLDVAAALCRGCDVIVEGFRPGVMERLGLAPHQVASTNPGVVYARITGWGQEGPMSSMAGHDINYIGLTGVLHAIGADEPLPPLNLIGDYAGGALYAVVGILAALIERTSTGHGGVVDAAMVDGAGALLGPIRALEHIGMWSDQRGTNLLDGGAPFYRTYQTADDRYVAVGALEPAFYEAMVNGLGLRLHEIPDRNNPQTWPRLTELFTERFASRTRDEWNQVFDGTDACVTPVLTMSEVADHPHNADRNAVVDGRHGPRPAVAPRINAFDEDHKGRYRDGLTISDTLVGLGVDEATVQRLERTGRSYRW